ncbi:hypothetical protein [Maliponia aquimaris]|uniref:Uncharacterized protein n=1 Tax=Maliponia aquimaris TaxID=1673631 RepID=A0A238L5P7_9RHOB|nr:hypothetical protein [Maliponia aquimaris]SMX50131.1 hypothetical protein MAA8898_04619 [Maliponia aquimaris]
MSDRAELAALLARAAGHGTRPPLSCPASPEEAAGLVAHALRGCIAPRRLTVRADDQPCLVAEAAGGNLLRLLHAPPPLDRLSGRPLTPADLDALADGLRAVLPGGQVLEVRHARPDTPPDPLHSGLPADLLLSRLGIAPFTTVVPDPLDWFQQAAEDMLLAILTPDAAPQVLHPAPALTDAFLETLSAVLAQPDGPAASLQADEMLFLDAGAVTLGLTRTAGGPRALVFEAGTAADLAGFWAGMPHSLVPLAE